MKQILTVIIFVIALGCKSEKQSEDVLTADEIIDKSIEVCGGRKFENSRITFAFRDRIYVANRKKGLFSLLRITINDAKDSIVDILNNTGFERYVNGERIKVEDSMAVKYTASVNSVHYFSVLPFGLNDKAVNKTLLGKEQIKAKDYYKIKITFNEEGGGEDFEDVFIYWINTETFKPDYIAYSYNEEEGVGMRFREAYNESVVNGLRFVNYNNYKPGDTKIVLNDLGKAFEINQLKPVSKIELKNIAVDLIDH